jgi:pimeloyl-ACP methyl ester carboxylesterase
LFVAHGVAVLAYDKRGVGQSGGVYPGDLASEETINTLAGDAAAAARFVAAQAGIDRSRVGFYGLSQGGWIIPQAAVRAAGVVAWALIQSGPTVTQGESDAYAGFAASLPLPEAERRARELGPSGYDPAPWISRLTIPVLWLYAGHDLAQPTGTSMEILRRLSAGHDFTTVLFPDALHPLFDRNGFPPTLFPTAGGWLKQHGLA